MQFQLFTNPPEPSGAHFSECGKYRYALWRVWDACLPAVMFIGLNPSTANADTDDPTIRKVRSFAKKWGYGGVYMLNLFPYISTDPEQLKCEFNERINTDYLHEFGQKASMVVFAWGAFEIAGFRSGQVSQMFPNAKALVINKDGSPRHPLYVPGNVVPVNFK